MAGEKTARGFVAFAKSRAGRILGNVEKLGKLLDAALIKSYRSKNRLLHVWSDLFDLIKMVRAWKSRRFREIPCKTILTGTAAIFYFVNPLDIIHDRYHSRCPAGRGFNRRRCSYCHRLKFNPGRYRKVQGMGGEKW